VQPFSVFFPFLGQDLSCLWLDNILADLLLVQIIYFGLLPAPVLFNADDFSFIKMVQNIPGRISEGLQEDCHREFPSPVNADIQKILGIKLKIKPRTPQGNNPGGIEELTAGMGLSLVMIKEGPGGPMELADNHSLGSIVYKSPPLCHHGDSPEIDILFLDIPDAFCSVHRVCIKHHQSDSQSDRGIITHALVQAIFLIIFCLFKGIFDKFQG